MRDVPDNWFDLFARSLHTGSLYVKIGNSVVTELGGLNWIKECSISGSSDSPTKELEITLWRSLGNESIDPHFLLSPLNDPEPLLTPHQTIEVFAAMVPSTTRTTLSRGDMIFLFEGRIDDVESNPVAGTVTIRARDLIGELQDLYLVEEPGNERTYTTGDAEDAIEAIIDDAYSDNYGSSNLSPTPLTLPNGATGFTMSVSPAYTPGTTSAYEACRRISDLFGWEIRVGTIYDSELDYDVFTLVLQPPVREQPNPDYVLPDVPSEVIAGPSISKDNVRNYISVYRNAISTPEDAIDTDSLQKYGPRYARFAQGSDSQLDTASEAQAFADAALADLKDPIVELRERFRLMLWVEVNDVYTRPADGIVFDTDQDLTVKSYKHTIGDRGSSTVIGWSGQPTSSRRRFLLARDDVAEMQ